MNPKLIALRVILMFGVSGNIVPYASANVSIQSEFELAEAFVDASIMYSEARLELGTLRLVEVERLYDAGHASWIEYARQRARVEGLRAWCESSRSLARFVTRLRDHSLSSAPQTNHPTHALRLFHSNSNRLVGWFDTQTIPREIAADLRTDSAETLLMERIEQATAMVDRHQTRVAQLTGSDDQNRRLRVAQLRLSVAKSWRTMLQLERQHLKTLPTRKNLDRSSEGFGDARTIGPWSNVMLGLSTQNLALLERHAGGRRRVAELRLSKCRRRRDAIRERFVQGHASQQEMRLADESVERAELEVQRLAPFHASGFECRLERGSDTRPDSEQQYWAALNRTRIRHPTIVRHLIQLRRQRLALSAGRSEKRAELEVLSEMYDRLVTANLTHASGQRERENAQLEVRLAGAEVLALREQDELLKIEEQRFARYLLPQLQNERPPMPGWRAMSVLVARTAGVQVASAGLVAEPFQARHPVAYRESSIIDPVSLCLWSGPSAGDERPLQISRSRSSRGEQRGLHLAVDDLRFAGSIPEPSTLLLSAFDLQRLCRFYCDLPGSFCPKPRLGSDQLFSSFAVRVASHTVFLRHDDWRAIRGITYARVPGPRNVQYSGIRGYSGIPVGYPTIRRVRQMVRYRPSFRIP